MIDFLQMMDGGAGDAHVRVAPLDRLAAAVFVPDVLAAGEPDQPVNHHDLAVNCGSSPPSPADGHKRMKNTTLHAGVGHGAKKRAAQVPPAHRVHEQAALDAFAALATSRSRMARPVSSGWKM